MAEFIRKDFVDDEGMAAPLVLKQDWEDLLVTLKKVRDVGMLVPTPSKGGSTKALKEETIQLTAAQEQMIKVNKRLATEIAKDNDEYRKQEQALIRLKVEIKNKNALGEKEAIQVNKMNSSLTQLEAALNINRVAYAKLGSEEERASKAGQNLLKVIQGQKEGVSQLRESMGQFNGNVGNYTTSILKAQAAIKKQEEETKALIVSQKGLDQKTAEGKKAFDNLTTAIQNNVTQINIYRKDVGMAEVKTKDLEKAVDDTADGSADLAMALGGNIPVLGAMITKSAAAGEGIKGVGAQIKNLIKQSLLFLATPLGLVLAGLALILGSLGRYFSDSTEGQDKWNKVMASGEAILDSFMDVLGALGKALVTVVTEPKKVWESFLNLLKPIKDALVTMWESPLEAAKAFGKFLWDNIVNRIKAIGVLGEGIGQILSGEFAKGARTIANGTIQLTTGIENGYNKLEKVIVDTWKSASDSVSDYFNAVMDKEAKARAIQDRANKFRKDTIQDIIDDSITELEVSKQMSKVKDDLRFSEESRLTALREANRLLKEQSEGDVALAKEELAILKAQILEKQDSLDISKITYDQAQELANLESKVNKTEQAYLDGKKKRLTEEFALVSSIQKRRLEQITLEKEAFANLNKWRLEDTIATNERILQDEFTNLGEQTNAIVEIGETRIQLAEDVAAQEIEAAKDAAKARVNLSTEERDAIYNNAKLSFEQQLALEDQYREDRFATDQAYVDDKLRIEGEMFSKIVDINQASVKRIQENTFTILARDAKKTGNVIDEVFARAMIDAEKQFADTGNVKDYYDSKQQLQENAQRNSLESHLDYLNKQRELTKEGSAQRFELDAQIAETELALLQGNNALKLEAEKLVQDGYRELSTTGVDLALETMSNLFAAEDEKRQERLEQIQATMDAELLAAGDNETAQVEIKNKAAAETQKIRVQQAQAARKQAMFEKAAAIISIAINVAKGIGMAIGTYPPPASFVLAGITAALGALQLAAVISKPIPSYAVGTEDHVGGAARVGEKGSELVTLPTGEQFLTPDRPTIMDLPAHTKVDTHRKTINKLAINSLTPSDTRGTRKDVEYFDKFGKKLDNVERAIRNKKEQHWNIDRRGMQAMVKNAETRQYFMDQLYR